MRKIDKAGLFDWIPAFAGMTNRGMRMANIIHNKPEAMV